MAFAKVYSAQTNGLEPYIVKVEIDISRGLNSFTTVGLPDKAVEESRDRVSAAIKNTGFKSPKEKNQKVVASLAPADIKKEGPVFDLPIAMAYLLAGKEIKFDPEGKLFLGELSLDGKVRAIKGVLPLVKEAKDLGFEGVFVPKENAREAALVDKIDIYPVETLKDLIAHLDKKIFEGKKIKVDSIEKQPKTKIPQSKQDALIDFSDVRGQDTAKRGLEIAAAGKHNIAMYGPPGTGKTMLAKAFTSILPKLSFAQILEVTSIHSVAGVLDSDLITHPPLRSPHHTSSYVALVGGGAYPKPGEITLAHRGVLFLDEFPEFERRVLESLRQPLEDNIISITRSRGSAKFPANFILIAAMNPCPCGNFGSDKECVCSPNSLQKYKRKISGPIMDRIDIWLEVSKVEHEKLSDHKNKGEESKDIRERVEKAREAQDGRFSGKEGMVNSDMNAKDLEKHVELPDDVKDLLISSAKKLDLSARAHHKIIKIAQTIADLEDSKDIGEEHILEALQYRPKEVFFG